MIELKKCRMLLLVQLYCKNSKCLKSILKTSLCLTLHDNMNSLLFVVSEIHNWSNSLHSGVNGKICKWIVDCSFVLSWPFVACCLIFIKMNRRSTNFKLKKQNLDKSQFMRSVETNGIFYPPNMSGSFSFWHLWRC